MATCLVYSNSSDSCHPCLALKILGSFPGCIVSQDRPFLGSFLDHIVSQDRPCFAHKILGSFPSISQNRPFLGCFDPCPCRTCCSGPSIHSFQVWHYQDFRYRCFSHCFFGCYCCCCFIAEQSWSFRLSLLKLSRRFLISPL